MDGDEDRIELQRLRRVVAERWPEGDGRERALRALDEMVWEAHKSTAEAE
jgi:hypothetical protein